MEFDNLERCAVYVAARASLDTVHRAAQRWPSQFANQARRAAVDTILSTAEALGHDPGSPQRRRCLRGAMTTAVELATVCDVVQALGIADDVAESLRLAGRTVSLLGLMFHASVCGEP